MMSFVYGFRNVPNDVINTGTAATVIHQICDIITENMNVKQIESQPGHINAIPLEVDPGTGKK
jgi:hypothetical protein